MTGKDDRTARARKPSESAAVATRAAAPTQAAGPARQQETGTIQSPTPRSGTAATRRRRKAAPAATVTMQARVDAEFARQLVQADAPLLGLSGPSDLVREGLRLVHNLAKEAAMAAAYDEFYQGKIAPVPEGAAAIWG
jgi:hypothetical protein